MQAPRFLAALLRLLNRTEALAAALSYVAVAVLLLADVLAREFTGQAILGAPQIAVLFAAVAAFLGLGIATAAGTHLRPNVLDWVVPVRFEARIGRVSDLLAAAAFLYFGWHAALFVMSTYEWGDRAEVLYIYLWPIQMVIPYALAASGLRHLAYAIWPTLKPEPAPEGLEASEMGER